MIDPVEELLKRVTAAGGVRALGRLWGIRHSRICDATSGRRPVGDELLKKMGLAVTTKVVRVKK